MLALYWLQLALAGGIILFRPYYLAQVVEGKVVLHDFDHSKKVRAVLAVSSRSTTESARPPPPPSASPSTQGYLPI